MIFIFQDLVTAYGSAVGGALSVAMGLKTFFARTQVRHFLHCYPVHGCIRFNNPIKGKGKVDQFFQQVNKSKLILISQVSNTLQRMVPLGAVAVANAINIPMMRQK